ncbi:hypothetical protein M434DRAFT_123669 [Hypoxylon sp. CO27-5]|nr:hypothetical protein M434DRAFT_123669 [Hypoxylon sp. CO27-5]
MTRQEHMPLTLAKLLAHVIPRKSTNASNEDNSSDLESSSTSTGRSQGSATDSDVQSSTSYDSRSSMNITDSDATSLSDTTKDAHVTIDNINMKYVFIIIKASGSKLVQFEVANMKAVEFFRWNLPKQLNTNRREGSFELGSRSTCTIIAILSGYRNGTRNASQHTLAFLSLHSMTESIHTDLSPWNSTRYPQKYLRIYFTHVLAQAV